MSASPASQIDGELGKMKLIAYKFEWKEWDSLNAKSIIVDVEDKTLLTAYENYPTDKKTALYGLVAP